MKTRRRRCRKVDPQQLSIENWLDTCLDKSGKKYKITREELLNQLIIENGKPV